MPRTSRVSDFAISISPKQTFWAGQHDKEVTDFLNAAGQLDLAILKFSFSAIKEVILKLNVKRASGHDLITAKNS